MYKKRTGLFCGLLVWASITCSWAQDIPRKYQRIQQYMNEAAENGLVGISIYVKTPKHGEWIGLAGFSNFETKELIKKESVFSLASIGKMYNAVGVLKLVEDGKLDLRDNIVKYLHEDLTNRIPHVEKITIGHLLNHTSGLPDYDTNPELNALYLSGNLKLDTLQKSEVLKRFAFTFNKPESFGQFSYSSTNYLLLSMIMDNVLEKGHSAYLRTAILQKNGFQKTYYKEAPKLDLVDFYGDVNQDGKMENLTSETIETTNWYSGDDGIYSTIGDASKFLQALFDGKILKKSTLEEMTTWNDQKNPEYGLGVMVDKGFPYGMLIGHSGRGIGVTSDLYYFPKQDITVAILCNTGLRLGLKESKASYHKLIRRIIKKLFIF